jgi:hypothetical protein
VVEVLGIVLMFAVKGKEPSGVIDEETRMVI